MKRILPVSFLALAFTATIFFNGCSKLAESLPTAVTSTQVAHAQGWNDSTSANFHGKLLLSGSYNLGNCQSCHSSQYNGGSSGISCFQCHQTYPHPSDWLTTSSASYHGKYLKSLQWQLSMCASCHGSNFQGGTSQKSCYTCHADYPHPSGFAAASGHPAYLRAKNYQPMQSGQCQTCHGASYIGGAIANVTCEKAGCHATSTGALKSPEACNTCHGNFTAAAGDTLSWAPPQSLNGSSSTTDPGVGAHQIHLTGGTTGGAMTCGACHTVPASVFASGHIDATAGAEVPLTSALAHTVTNSHVVVSPLLPGGPISPNPSFDANQLKCSNTYCHGDFKNGNNFAPAWNVVNGSQKACGTCHGDATKTTWQAQALPANHFAYTYSLLYCADPGCHGATVDSTGRLNPSLHINGKLDVGGQAYDF